MNINITLDTDFSTVSETHTESNGAWYFYYDSFVNVMDF